MKDEDVKIGMKVVPFQKTVWGDFSESQVWRDGVNRGFLYVQAWDLEEKAWILGDIDGLTFVDGEEIFDGDFFNASDFEPYEEKPRRVASDFVPRPPVIIRESYNGAFTLEIIGRGKTYAYGTLEKVYEKLSELFAEDIWGLRDN